MSSPTPLEVAAALRSAAEFCRDPESPKCIEAEARDATGMPVQPTDPQAVRWCAYGHFCRTLGLSKSDHDWTWGAIVSCHGIATHFDDSRFDVAAHMCDQAAAEIEAALPVAGHAPAKEPQHALDLA